MKKLFLILLCLMFIPAVIGISTKNDYLQLKSIAGSINSVTLDTIDSNAENTINVIPGDKLTFVVRIYNNDTHNIPIRIEGGDDDGLCADIEDYSWEETIDAETTRTSESGLLRCRIPTDTDNGEYNLKLNFLCRPFSFNSTDSTWRLNDTYQTCIKSRTYTVVVKGTEEITTSTGITTYSTSYFLNNMSAACSAFKSSTDACFGYVDKVKTCADDLSTVKEECGTYKQKSDDCAGNLDRATTEKTSAENEKVNLQNQINNMLTYAQCNNQTASAVNVARSEASSKNNTTLLIVGAIGLGVWYWQNEKKKKSNVANSIDADTGLFSR